MEVRIIHSDQIIVPPERQRQEFDEPALAELGASIRKYGLYHAIQVRADGVTLVSGERRLRAIKQHLRPLHQNVKYSGKTLDVGYVPVVIANSEDPLELEEIELSENIDRKDLTWQERVRTNARFHDLRLKQATKAAAPLPSIADTAKELKGSAEGSNQGNLRKQVIVAQHLDKPEVAKAKTLDDAWKALKKNEDIARNKALAAAVGETYNTGVHRVIHSAFEAELVKPEWIGYFDVICTDPPYGMGADEFGDAGGRLLVDHKSYKDNYEHWQETMRSFASLSMIVTKPQAHLYAWTDIENFFELSDMLTKVGWDVFRTPITNIKKNSGRVPRPEHGPRRTTEWCLYAIKGGKMVTAIYPDHMITEQDELLGHGAQKPVMLYTDLLKRSCRPGDRVLDPFAGTGTLLPAAHELALYATLIEKDQSNYGICLKRAEALDRQATLLAP